MWIPKVGQAVQIDNQGPLLLVEEIGGSGLNSFCKLKGDTEHVAVPIARLNPEGKPRPMAGDHWDTGDYLMSWEGEEFLLSIAHNTSDLRLVALCKNAENYARRKSIFLEAALPFFINFREVLRKPQKHGHQFDCLMAWREAMKLQHEEIKGYVRGTSWDVKV